MKLVALATLLSSIQAHADCISQADADARTAAADKRNEASYQSALARKKLTPVKLVEHSWGARGYHKQNDAPPTGLVEVSEREVNCEHTPLEFVQAADHKVYKVGRGPHPAKITKSSVCTCFVQHWGCGGANMGRESFGYELPAGATYGGELVIPYDTELLQLTYKTEHCPRNEPPP
jgi:hypothetical protein